MQEYNKKVITGEMTTWTRANQIIINNIAGQNNTVLFQQEVIKVLPDKEVIKTQIDSIAKDIVDINEIFELLNPITGEPVGVKMSYGQLAAAIYSIYVATAEADRIAKEPVVEPGPV